MKDFGIWRRRAPSKPFVRSMEAPTLQSPHPFSCHGLKHLHAGCKQPIIVSEAYYTQKAIRGDFHAPSLLLTHEVKGTSYRIQAAIENCRSCWISLEERATAKNTLSDSVCIKFNFRAATPHLPQPSSCYRVVHSFRFQGRSAQTVRSLIVCHEDVAIQPKNRQISKFHSTLFSISERQMNNISSG